MASSKASFTALCKLSALVKTKPIRILVLGQSQVGKSALVVRYLTRRFIGEYASPFEKVYQTTIQESSSEVLLEIMDCNANEKDCERHEANIRWADVFLLMYSVTDRCSFDDCNREKFLINYNKRRKRITGPSSRDSKEEPTVLLVANKKDLTNDRMVSTEEGLRRSKDIGCKAFHEISVRESVDEVKDVFATAIRFLREDCKTPRLRRAVSEVHEGVRGSSSYSASSSRESSCTDTLESLIDNIVNLRFRKSCQTVHISPRSTTMPILHNMQSYDSATTSFSRDDGEPSYTNIPFRARACTDGLLHKGKFQKRPAVTPRGAGFRERNLSIAMRGELSYE